MDTPEPTPETAAPDAPAPPADRDLVTLGGLEAEFTELEHELERVDRPGADSAGPEAPVS